MQPLRINVDIVMERVPLTNRWASEYWRPFAVVAASPERPRGVNAPPVVDGSGTRWCYAGHEVELHPTEAEGYFLNLTSPAPSVFVMWRLDDAATPPAQPVLATVSYNHAGRLMDGGERVDRVAMPAEILDRMRPFVAEHYKPEPKRKVRRNDPFAEGAFVRDHRDKPRDP